jgi:hypothetical protein
MSEVAGKQDIQADHGNDRFCGEQTIRGQHKQQRIQRIAKGQETGDIPDVPGFLGKVAKVL